MFRDIYRILSVMVIVPGSLFLLGAWFPSPVPIPVPEARVFYRYVHPPDPWELERIAQVLLGSTPALSRDAPVYGTVEQELASRGLSDLPRITLSRVTAYNPVIRQTDPSPNISSCGRNLENQIALSRDLFFDNNGVKYLCGARVLLISTHPTTGAVMDVRETVVWDTMNERYARTADVLFPTTDESVAYAWGARRGVLVVLPQ